MYLTPQDYSISYASHGECVPHASMWVPGAVGAAPGVLALKGRRLWGLSFGRILAWPSEATASRRLADPQHMERKTQTPLRRVRQIM